MSDKRAQFFFLSAVVCFVLIPVAGERFAGVTIGVGVVYLVLALASALDHRSRNNRG